MPESVDHALCPSHCPGCSDRGATAEERLAEKTRFLKVVLSSWQRQMAPIQTPDPSGLAGYRHKACLSACWVDKDWHLGLKHRQSVVPIHDCPVHAPLVRDTVHLFTKIVPSGQDFPLVYYAQSGAQVTLVVKSRHMPDCEWLSPSVERRLAVLGVEGLWIHLHPSAGNRVFAKTGWHLRWGTPWSFTNAYGTPLQYGPTAFQQLIPDLFNHALDRAESFLSPEPDDLVVDLYSGIGSTLARWTRRTPHVIGVEVGGEAVTCARSNAPDATVLRGTCAHRIAQLTEMIDRPFSRRLAWINPPRTGIEPEVVHWLTNTCRPVKMVYLSCNPRTLARDLEAFQAAGYDVDMLMPFDFFPHARHTETLALITVR
ncbi:MAG: hypothetical protein SWH61_15530 [Thermodesulfobacteriota bacterium]|nr:hypothetical protein [Thermodesulfobacteriota bacterium]